MLAVYCKNAEEAKASDRDLLLLGGKVTGCREEFGRISAESICSVGVVPDLTDPEILSWLTTLIRNTPWPGWIVVTDFSPANASQLVQLTGVREVVWSEAPSLVLRRAVSRVLEAEPEAHLIEAVRKSELLHPDLRRAVAEACLLRRLPRTVAGLCERAHISENRLRYLWRQYTQAGRSPKELVDWLLLARARRLYPRCGCWDRVANELGVKENTLRNICMRLTGQTLSQFRHGNPGSANTLLKRWWADALDS